MSDPEDVTRGIEEMRGRLDGAPLSALVNNAGISPKGENGARLDSLRTDLDLWREVFQVNFYAPLALARGLFEELKQGQGSVVNVTSIAGGRVHRFAGSAYATSKAALASLTARDGGGFRPARHPRQRHRAGRDRHAHPLAPGQRPSPRNSLGAPRQALRSGIPRSISSARTPPPTSPAASCT